jgi:aspartate aminotransferase
MLAERIRKMVPSVTSMLTGKIADLKASGEDVIGFNAGEPDFPTPAKVTKACECAIAEGKTKYSAVGGILPLKKAICRKLKEDNNLLCRPEHITVSTGAKQALYNAVMAICDPGDEVIIPTPCWVSYVEMVKLAQGIPILVPTNEDFSLNIRAITEAITPKTKGIIINTPNNPTGAVYSQEELKALGDLAVKHDFYVICDEVYEKLIYDNKKHVSIAALSPDIFDKCITINGFSKAYSMTGWRLGYAAAPWELSEAMTSLQSHITSNSVTFIQWAAIEGLENCSDEIEDMRIEFSKRRDYMLERLCRLPGISCAKPGGAFYLLPDVSAYFGKRDGDRVINNSVDFCEYVLEKARVAIVPGAAFEMPATVRFSYSSSMENIKEGMERLEKALKDLTA